MPLRAIVYTSDILKPPDETNMARLIAEAERFNRLAGVTGVLLFDGARFLQYFEGPLDGVEAVYARVKSSRIHARLVELASGQVHQRLFPYWAMHIIPIAAMDTSRLVAASWTDFEVATGGEERPVAGMYDLEALVKRHLPRTSEPPAN